MASKLLGISHFSFEFQTSLASPCLVLRVTKHSRSTVCGPGTFRTSCVSELQVVGLLLANGEYLSREKFLKECRLQSQAEVAFPSLSTTAM